MTIVILIILATISIGTLFGENGLIKKAQEAKDHQSNAIAMEEIEMNKIAAEYANVMGSSPAIPSDTTGPTVNIEVITVKDTSIQVKATATDESGLAENDTYRFLLNEEEKGKNTTGEYTFEGLTAGTKYTIKVEVQDKVGNLGSATTEVTTSVSTISTSTDYTGYYADINGDKQPEGVIYADLAIGGSGQWGNSEGTYTIPKINSGLKNYAISETKYSGKFGNKEVISALEGSGTEDRFYVMALTDVGSSTYEWSKDTITRTVTETEFGTGKANTAAVIEESRAELWELIGTQVEQGWFVPSKEEWSAFAEELGIDDSNYSNFGLNDWYWSSSQSDMSRVWRANFDYGYFDEHSALRNLYARLSVTF